MKIVHSLDALKYSEKPIALAAGTFDGLHKGHREVIETALSKAARHQQQAWVLTFDPHPVRVLAPEKAPPLLTSTKHRIHLMRQCGLEGAMLIPFTRDFAHIGAEEFLMLLKQSIPTLSTIVVGNNWTFGYKARGNTDMLKAWAEEQDVEVHVVSPILWKGKRISSSRIREAIQGAELDEVEHMLGRPYSVMGSVIHGEKIGHQLGYPTANIEIRDEVNPKQGIYAVLAIINGRACDGAAYFGTRPTFDRPHEPALEVHLLDQYVDIYGAQMEVIFIQFIREDRQFDNSKALAEHIEQDVRQVRKALQRYRRKHDQDDWLHNNLLSMSLTDPIKTANAINVPDAT